MSDERYCRFATKLTADGVTLIDGIMSASMLEIMVNRVFTENDLPVMGFRHFYSVPEGFHMHFDICINGGLIAFEVTAVAPPVLTRDVPRGPEIA